MPILDFLDYFSLISRHADFSHSRFSLAFSFFDAICHAACHIRFSSGLVSLMHKHSDDTLTAAADDADDDAALMPLRCRHFSLLMPPC